MAATSSSSKSWMPAPGRQSVNIGSSLTRALKARKGIPAPARNARLPDKEFYSFRYNFMPESVDPTKPGTIEVKRGNATSVNVQRASKRTGEGGLTFIGQERPAEYRECVLIYDEDSQNYYLEKLDSSVILTYDLTTSRVHRHPGSPIPSASGSGPSTQLQTPPLSTSRRPQKAKVDEELEALLSEALEDASGEVHDEPKTVAPAPQSHTSAPLGKVDPQSKKKLTLSDMRKAKMAQKEEGEASEGEIIEDVKPTPRSQPATQARTAKPAQDRPLSAPKSRPSAVQPPSVPLATTSPKRPHVPDVEEETLEFGRPSQPAKRTHVSPSPSSKQKDTAPALALSFPGSGGDIISFPPAPPAALDSEDEDWSPVEPSPPAPAPELAFAPRTIVMEEIVPTSDRPADVQEPDEEEPRDFDMDAFEAEMNLQLGDMQGADADGDEDDGDGDDDFLEEAISVREGSPDGLFGSAGAAYSNDEDDEDYSSSDDTQKHLDTGLPLSQQNPEAMKALRDEALKEHPFFLTFYADAWPIKRYIGAYLRELRRRHRTRTDSATQVESIKLEEDEPTLAGTSTRPQRSHSSSKSRTRVHRVSESPAPPHRRATSRRSDASVAFATFMREHCKPSLASLVPAFLDHGDIMDEAHFRMLLHWPPEKVQFLLKEEMRLTREQRLDVSAALDYLRYEQVCERAFQRFLEDAAARKAGVATYRY
ncbi:hypothetical protein WOLCODRAFT_162861 [Wolfiporia cocos MD-104 SS10]|uniref:Transcription elongation factor Eaf N-terminal domain-containing protein n=1 Tax=Wolfiporia cocos (strain MD-104) TaxID=742152 RepID=A0A2H3JH16_WOLCO|nr:hypothetical protein WOLCODRAFT_162861 [Wolfiporia cocos MD-104 SS10]